MERVWGSLAFTRARCLQNERALFDHLLKDTVRTHPCRPELLASALKSSAFADAPPRTNEPTFDLIRAMPTPSRPVPSHRRGSSGARTTRA